MVFDLFPRLIAFDINTLHFVQIMFDSLKASNCYISNQLNLMPNDNVTFEAMTDYLNKT